MNTQDVRTTTKAHVDRLSPEDELDRFVTTFDLGDAPHEVRQVATQILRTVTGTTVAGAAQDGVAELRELLVRQGGHGDARSLVFGDPLPATSAALLNATMARALDYCDTMVPGLHLGSSVIPAALVAAEAGGGCSGRELMAGIVVGLEAGAHLNLSESQYGGFDPTGVAGLFGATAAVARILGLSADQTRDALALSFNRCSGSFQANADASLAVRFIQGFTASNAVQVAQLAQVGITGPANFLSGKFGYARLFGRGEVTGRDMVAGLGTRWEILGTFFKKFPCCGLAQGPTESALVAQADGVTLDDVAGIAVHLPDFAYGLIGHTFRIGKTPQVNAQFSAEYCVTNAFVRGAARIEHFAPARVHELVDHPLLGKVTAHHDPEITGHSASRLEITLKGGRVWSRTLLIGPGYPGNPLTDEDHSHGFSDCLDSAPHPLSRDQRTTLGRMLESPEEIADVGDLISQLISAAAPAVDTLAGAQARLGGPAFPRRSEE